MEPELSPPQISYFSKDSLVDLALLFALVNVGISAGELIFGMVGDVHLPLRISMALAVAVGIHRFGFIHHHRANNTAAGFPDPIVHDMQTGILNRSAFFARFDAALKERAYGFLMLIHANDIGTIDNRFGKNVGEYFLSSLVARFDATVQYCDLVGRLDRETYAIFLRDRTHDEADLIARRMCGATLLPLGDSADRAQLSAFVGYCEVAPEEAILDALERANDALEQAQSPDSDRLSFWRNRSEEKVIYANL